MYERSITLPTKDNDGHSLTAQRRAIELELLALVGGYSKSRSMGAWRGDDGKVYTDSSYVYTMAVDAAQDDAIMARMPVWCESLRQLCLYTTRKACDVAFVAPVSNAQGAA